MASVALDHVDKSFPGGARALADFTLEIADGERMVVVGPSGCGKSTVLRLVAGLEAPTSGTIRIGGRAVGDLSPQERNVAMVFQDYALYPHRTVRGNLEFPLRMRRAGRDEIERRVAWAAGLLELGPLLDRLPRQLSGGQRQRVAMGRALVREPTVFLLDEPLSNLDARLRSEVRAEIAELQRRTGTTMIYVTHDQVEAMTLGHRVAVLDRGRLQQVAPPRELYDAPANAFVASFVGSPPMNLVPARLAAAPGGAPALRIGGQLVPIAAERLPPAAVTDPDAPLTAGARPEAIGLAAEADPGAIVGTVERTELLGHETLVEVALDGAAATERTRLIARLAGAPQLAPGGAVRLKIDPARLYLFAADGRAL